MRVAAYQAPYLAFGSQGAVELIERQLVRCESEGVEMLCCPEAVIGGLAHESDCESPADVALAVDDGELAKVLAPLLATTVGVIVGFTERDPNGALYSSAAVLAGGVVAAVYRKVYPGYRTVLQPGERLETMRRGAATYGVIICNDIWYMEPARVLASAGAAVLFVPSNSGHVREVSESFRARGENLPIARAVENAATVVVADIAGHDNGRQTCGFTAIVDPDGVVVAKAKPYVEDLVIADVAAQRRPFDPRGWDGHTNHSVRDVFVALWDSAP